MTSAASSQRWLRVVTCLLLIGQAWWHWNGQMPLSALLWDEQLLREWLFEAHGIEWHDWVSDPSVVTAMAQWSRGFGVFYAAMAAVVMLPGWALWRTAMMGLTTLFLMLLAWLKFQSAGRGLANFLEHAGQFGAPLLLAWVLVSQAGKGSLGLARLLVAMVFFFHGWLALGIPAEAPLWDHSTPGSFLEMTMLSLGLESEVAARRILVVAGVLDWAVALAVLLPLPRKVLMASLGYMVVWGFVTALARPWSYVQAADLARSLNLWLPEMLCRTPHWGLPLWLCLELGRRSSTPSNSLQAQP